ncbi:MAG: ABC transporter substrate-binding protein [Gammaproteobacteria bacterium]|nr:ABC transporter substrate-binding protein [Gammaproteobacteria bacterium]MBU1557139.1 ABC transporter substrate-binding protein [Gammaproteobacteria bacterium]MBU2069184.1 ABC transporter substrate-binding protein [Gammaproteobacteria bacterium]MBU2184159.1 ABC transporter substrate-binding protein [Gammaproteobacteria bacterium]MBU2204949.1 ABC transporter substrate-binding protein [Gammaproteobacteria bacterium]
MTSRYQPEQQSLTLGFVPLLDAAPLIVAQELGLFAAQGLNVSLQREASWASIRDKVAFGVLDGAQMIAPLPLASSLGLGAAAVPMTTALVLSSGGNAITLSQRLLQQLDLDPTLLPCPLASGKALQQYLLQQLLRQSAQQPLRLATVSPYSCHHYQLHYWLSTAGISPRQVEVIGVAPAAMTAQLASGAIDGFCVGEPWSSLAQLSGHGTIVTSCDQLWHNWQEKVFAVSQQFANSKPQCYLALLSALLQACHWLQDIQSNSDKTAQLWHWLAQPQYLALADSGLSGSELFNKAIAQAFFGPALNMPWRSQGAFILQQMRNLQQWQGPLNQPLLQQVYRPDLYRQVAANLGFSAPAEDWRLEGEIGSKGDGSRFIDGVLFGLQQ